MVQAMSQRDIMTVRLQDSMDFSEPDKPRLTMGISSVFGTRPEQQDSVFGQIDGQSAIAVVCDGMGGMNGGELASQTAVKLLVEDYFKKKPISDVPEFLKQETLSMDTAVYGLKDENGKRLNGGTTVVCVIVEENKLWWLSVGDSRIYIVRSGEILTVNQEHNFRMLLDERLKKGLITEEEYHAGEDQAEALISYLGMGNVTLMDINKEPFILMENDIVILCSDGLYKRLPDQDILEIISYEEPDMQRAARRLTEVVMKRTQKSQDNTSIVMLEYGRY